MGDLVVTNLVTSKGKAKILNYDTLAKRII